MAAAEAEIKADMSLEAVSADGGLQFQLSLSVRYFMAPYCSFTLLQKAVPGLVRIRAAAVLMLAW